MSKLLFIVDVQYDFLPGGSLAVAGGNEIIPEIIKHINSGEYSGIILSMDSHKDTHTSFAVNHNVDPFTVVNGEMKWTKHCVVGTQGRNIHQAILNEIHLMHPKNTGKYNVFYVYKGLDDNKEEYSAYTKKTEDIIDKIFDDVKDIVVVGLATDYCVKHTAMDLKNYTDKNIIVDTKACKGVSEKTTTEAIQEMTSCGCKLM